ncbi:MULTISPECIES: hypothetical protein [Pseudofrankia]|uniref:hypothetical protein n=1 Tax=Pseudofrankia TaxID=2994363 RepID=UPI000234D020|nr:MULTISPECIES: hypothetical protein [Pseudofrankia]OHV39128.1 hypothetical protein BCD49_12615 [Pseudofrankia sp. EUN1h]
MNRIDDTDLLAHLRALRTDPPPGGIPPTFGPAVHARARRHRSRGRLAAVAAVVAVIVAGFAIPVGLRTGFTITPARTVDPARPPLPWAYGGLTTNWLPAGSVHVGDDHGFATPAFAARGPVPQGPDGWISNQSWTYNSAFVRPDGGQTAMITVTVDWLPDADGYTVDNLRAYFPAATGTTVAGQPALQVGDGVTPSDPRALASEPPLPGGDGTNARYQGALYWQAGPHGPTLGVIVSDVVPVDWAEVRAIAAGLRPGTRPGAVGEADTAAIRAVVAAAFTPTTPDDQWVAAVQDGQALLATRRKILTDYPGFAATLKITVSQPASVDATHATIETELTFTEPKHPISPGRISDYVTDTMVRTGSGWQVSGASFCAAFRTISLLEQCP